MAHDSEHKIKLLLLYDILCRQTDENHALNTDEIIAELAKHNVKVSRKVLPLDIALLNDHGYEVLSYKKKYHYYYVVNRHFDAAEISMLTDVVKASKLSSGQKSSLIKKFSEMSGHQQAESLSKHIINCDTPKRSNSHIIYSIDAIDRAINEKKKISFRYFSLDEKKNKVYRKNGDRYVTNPLVMVWSKDNYYLIAYPDKYDDTITYRIDRMESVEVEDIDRVEKEAFADFDVEQYRAQVFSMFGGEMAHVELQFSSEMIDDMYDKFGEEIKIKIKSSGEQFKTIVPIQVSPTFFAWVAGSRGKVHILYPETVRNEFDKFVDEIKEAY